MLNEGGLHVFTKRLDHLHHELLTTGRAAGTGEPFTRLAPGLQPARACVTAPARVGAHVRRAAEASDAALCCRRAVALRVDLQRAADEEVAGILSGDLCERAVGPQIAVGADRKYIGVVRNVAFHAQLGAEAIDAVDEAGFDRGDQGRVRVQHEMPGDLALQSALGGVGWQDQFDRRGAARVGG